jgi:hypothetical protein
VQALAVDGSRVYWSTSTGEVVAQAKGTTQSTTLATNQTILSNFAADGVSLYWFDGSGEILRLPVSGGTPTALATGQVTTTSPTVAVDASRVYWTSAVEVAATTK